MAREQRDPWKLGAISYGPLPSDPTGKKVQASGRYRDARGRLVKVRASGDSNTKARNALERKVEKARTEHRGGDGIIRHDTKVSVAAGVWLDSKVRDRLAASTLRQYGWSVRTIESGSIGDMTLAAVNDIAVIEAWLSEVADERGEGSVKQARKVLSGILDIAERRGAIVASVMGRVKTPRSKPGTIGDRICRDLECDGDCGEGRRHADNRRAFTEAEAAAVLAAADAADRDATGKVVAHKSDVGDLAVFLFSTGVRVSEALHCVSWSDLDLDAGTVHVRGTKTQQADRVLSIGPELCERLRARADRFGTTGLVFGVVRQADKLGQPRDTRNVIRIFNRVFATAGVPWAGTHTFRRTVASWLDANGAPLAEIANQLGHANTNVTAGYLGRRVAPTRAASVMTLPTEPAEGHLRIVSGQ